MSISEPFDLAILPRGGVDPSFSAHAMWVLNVPVSYGYSHAVEPDDIDHNGGDCLLTNVVRSIAHRHEAMRSLNLLQLSGLGSDATLNWTEKQPIQSIIGIATRQDNCFLRNRIGLKPNAEYIVVAPGAGLRKKMWTAHKFHELCGRLAAQNHWQVVVSGAKSEVDLCGSVAGGLGPEVISSAGLLNLQELIGLLGQAKMFIGNDSGAGHLAGALGIPTISLHVQPRTGDPDHISAPEHYRPVGPYVTVVQPEDFLAPCQGRCESDQVHCLDQITVDHVWNIVLPILAQRDCARELTCSRIAGF